MLAIELKELAQKGIIKPTSLQIRKGQFAVFTGEEASGQVALFHLIAGLQKPTSGQLWLEDQLITHRKASDRDIGTVFAGDTLYPLLRVDQNIGYGLRYQTLIKTEIKERVYFAAELLNIEALLSEKPVKLTREQKLRVAIARAIVKRPRLLLFYNPLSGLSSDEKFNVRLDLHRLNRTLNITSLYLTYHQAEAMSLADTLVVMEEGGVLQSGKPLQLYQKPNSVPVAKFLGSPAMNLIQAQVSSDGRELEFSGQRIKLPAPVLESYNNRSILLGVRPDSIRIAEPQDKQVFKLRVELVEALGGKTLAYGRLVQSDQGLIVRLPGQVHTYAGELLLLAFVDGALHFFDLHSKKRIIF